MEFSTVTLFSHLFSGRKDVWFDGNKSFQKKGIVTLEHFRKHLAGMQPIGTYPVLDDSRCKWGCIDVDTDNLDIARDIQSVWEYFNISAWIERSRSKGYHIWIFADRWISASIFRKAGLFVEYIATGTNGIEVNPKAEAPWLSNVKYINTVRLPYDGQRVKDGRTVCIDSRQEIIPLDVFVRQAAASSITASELVPVARRWDQLRAKERLSRQLETVGNVPANTGANAKNQDAWQIVEGHRQIGKGERDNQFYTIARLLHGSGVPYELAQQKVAHIHRYQMEDETDFPLSRALEKIDRVFRSNG